MPYGATLLSNGQVQFRLWAPSVNQVWLINEDTSEKWIMKQFPEGWHELVTNQAGPGTRYRFELDDGLRIADPASRFQPEDVHGPSEVIDPTEYKWRNGEWRGRPWHEAVIYELHLGTFTTAGTFLGAIEKLDHLAQLGVTAVEVMPVADFPGRRNWGYDGVLPYAPDSRYGRPNDFKAFIDAAHARGLMVFLDVVYNHFGPEGNYLMHYAPDFFTDRYCTPWGDAINYDGPTSGPVREFFICNALYWLKEFRLDGLRLDAVHQIKDHSPVHILSELAERLRAAVRDRPVHLILENENNEASWLVRDGAANPKWYSAQWNDDVHHVLHTAATGENFGYYGEYLRDTEKLGRALAEGFAFQGGTMVFRGSPRGEPSAHLRPVSFVAFIQNHDQVGNRALGDRLSVLASVEAQRAVVAVYLLLPQIPMLFMGEEWNARQPFTFFCDFGGELGESIRRGRRAEFEFGEMSPSEIPDPLAEETFAQAVLNWQDVAGSEWLEFYRDLLSTRKETVVPVLPQIGGNAGQYELKGRNAVLVRWRLGDGSTLVLAANLSDGAVKNFPAPHGTVLWQEGPCGPEGELGPWAVNWWIE